MALNFKKECQTQYRKKIILTAFVLLLATLFAQTLLKLPQSYTLAPLRIVQVILVWISADVFAIVKMPKWWMQLSFFYISYSSYGIRVDRENSSYSIR